MNPRSASPNRLARIAVVGAPTVDGMHLRDALVAGGVPGARVDLYGSTKGEAVLSNYAGEARLIQEPELEELARHDLIFLCEPGDVASRVANAAPGAVIIDLYGCLPTGVAQLGVVQKIVPGARRFTVPHPLALLLAEVLQPLHRGIGLAEATAVVMRPAADFGQQGVEELRQQTVGLLNCSPVPVTTFGRQLAFNIVPEGQLAVGRRDLESRINREVAGVLGWESNRFAVKLLVAPVFHGHAVQLRFRLEGAGSLNDIRAILEKEGWLSSRSAEAAAAPLDRTDEMRISLSELSEDGMGSYWLWAVAGETGATGARQAVRLAATLFDL